MNDGWNIISASFGGMADATLLRDIALKGYFFTEEQLYESLQSRENFLTKMCWSIKFTKKGVAKLLGVYSVAVCAFVVAWAALMVKEKLRKRVRDISMIDATSHHFELAPSVNVKCTDIMIN